MGEASEQMFVQALITYFWGYSAINITYPGTPNSMQSFLDDLKDNMGNNYPTAIDNGIDNIALGVKRMRQNVVAEAVKAYDVPWPNESDMQERVAENMKISEGGIKIVKVYGDVITEIGRPSTIKTVEAFKGKYAGDHSKLCVVSSQPHAPRQFTQNKQGLPDKTLSLAAAEMTDTNVGIQQGVQECLAYVNTVKQQAIEHVTSHATTLADRCTAKTSAGFTV